MCHSSLRKLYRILYGRSLKYGKICVKSLQKFNILSIGYLPIKKLKNMVAHLITEYELYTFDLHIRR